MGMLIMYPSNFGISFFFAAAVVVYLLLLK